MEENTKDIRHAVIVGGGLIGVEVAEMLHTRNIIVSMLVREASFWNNVLPLQESKLISRHIESHGINVLNDTELIEITGDRNHAVTSVTTSSGEIIPCEFVALAVGVSPNISFLKNSGIALERGILVNDYLQTNIPDVYAIGDCAERTFELPGRKNIEQVWYTGRMMGEVVADTICGNPTRYSPGPWFNSAKFFDIEYQTYGNVSNELNSDESEFYWEHEDGKKAMHFIWKKENKEFTGINSFGLRLRHECFDRWLREKKSIEYVIENLAEANFDPEFFNRYEKQISASFANENLQTI
jgi:NADPH-dependent 2,4-dienoyl-CoA reductase/sulfur reductase-like enzyme